MYIKTIIFLILSYINLINSSSLRYVFVATHFRHGARAPIKINKKYEDTQKNIWKYPSELTGVGERMHYILGLINREKYILDNNFLSNNYDPHEIKIESTDVNRTLISALSQIQGLYTTLDNSGTGYVIHNNQTETAVPPHKMSANVEKLVKTLGEYALPNAMTMIPVHVSKYFEITSNKLCRSKIEKLKINNINNSLSLKKVANEFNKEFGKKLEDFIDKSFKFTSPYNIYHLNQICSDYYANFAEKRHINFFDKLNSTEIERFIQLCKNVTEEAHKTASFADSEGIVARLTTSKYMRNVITLMEKRIDADIKGEDIKKKYKDFSRPKMFLYSGHDTTLSAVEVFLMNTFKGKNVSFYLPTYASQISLEVFVEEGERNKSKNYSIDDYWVSYLFNGEEKMKVKFKEFKENVYKYSYSEEEINDYCGFEKNTLFDWKFITIIVLAVLLVIVIIILIVVIIKNKKNSNDDDNRVSNQISLVLDKED